MRNALVRIHNHIIRKYLIYDRLPIASTRAVLTGWRLWVTYPYFYRAQGSSRFGHVKGFMWNQLQPPDVRVVLQGIAYICSGDEPKDQCRVNPAAMSSQMVPWPNYLLAFFFLCLSSRSVNTFWQDPSQRGLQPRVTL